MAVGSFRVLLPVLGPEIPQHKVGAVRSREIGKPVDSAMLANPVSGVRVVGMGLFREPRANGLLRGKEPLLGLGYFVEPSRGLFVGSQHAYSPNFIGGLCIILARSAIAQAREYHPVNLWFTGNPSRRTDTIPQICGSVLNDVARQDVATPNLRQLPRYVKNRDFFAVLSHRPFGRQGIPGGRSGLGSRRLGDRMEQNFRRRHKINWRRYQAGTQDLAFPPQD